MVSKREAPNGTERSITTVIMTPVDNVCILHTNVSSEERGQSGKRGREQEKREESEEGASSPLYSESGTPAAAR